MPRGAGRRQRAWHGHCFTRDVTSQPTPLSLPRSAPALTAAPEREQRAGLDPLRVRAEKLVISSTMWVAGTVAVLFGWVGLEIAVGLWIGAHRGIVVALPGLLAFHALTVLVFLGVTFSPEAQAAIAAGVSAKS